MLITLITTILNFKWHKFSKIFHKSANEKEEEKKVRIEMKEKKIRPSNFVFFFFFHHKNIHKPLFLRQGPFNIEDTEEKVFESRKGNRVVKQGFQNNLAVNCFIAFLL